MSTLAVSPTDTQPVLEITNLHVRFGGLSAVRNFHLTVLPGTIHALIGPNGAGKTSALNAISGIYGTAAGRIVLRGKDVTGWPSHRIAAQGVARAFQNVELFKHMTVLENILLGRHLRLKYGVFEAALHFGRARREEIAGREQVEKVIDFLEMEAVRKEPVGVLPYGLQKRVELARALAMEPDLLLLDEPTTGMNRAEKEDMVRFILDIQAEFGTTILIIDHDMRVIMDIADRVTVMHLGEPLATGSPAEVAANPDVIKAYLGSVER